MSFNPTIVRLKVEQVAKTKQVKGCFNPTIVRLKEFLQAKDLNLNLVSILQ